ncbi:MAG: MATE family efflux transporter [Sandaracinaceae bacterium]|nr:MATE family efflux transporter [Sandaracinaceae bacterium]MDW8245950.1 MATE family efflux transporter [Sandaracinaceae bacterium]
MIESIPLVLTHLGSVMLGLVDTAVVGRLGQDALAGVGFAYVCFFMVTLVGIGVLLGLEPVLSQSYGRGDIDGEAVALRGGLLLAAVLSVPTTVALIWVAFHLEQLGVPTEAVGHGRDYLIGRSVGVLPLFLLVVFRVHLQSIGKKMPLVYGTIFSNAINLPVAWVLTHGIQPWMCGLGAMGAGLAVGIAVAVQMLFAAWGSRGELFRGGRWIEKTKIFKTIWLGLPIGVQLLVETGSFAVVTWMVAHHGATPLAGHHLTISVVDAAFHIALGIAGATSARVGRAVGAGDWHAAKRSSQVGMVMGGLALALVGFVLLVLPRGVARLLTNDTEAIEASLPFLKIVACFEWIDGIQAVAQAALRGAGDTQFPLLANLIAYWVIGLPLGWLLRASLGPQGPWLGIVMGFLVMAALSGWRLRWLVWDHLRQSFQPVDNKSNGRL